MTTTVQSRYSAAQVRISGKAGQELDLGVDLARGANAVTVDRADFIAAVETELDGTFIPHADLPATDDTRAKGVLDYYVADRSLEVLKAKALDMLAAVKHLEANPPVDEAAVDALTEAIIDADGTYSVTQNLRIREIARRLVKAGVTVKDPA